MKKSVQHYLKNKGELIRQTIRLLSILLVITLILVGHTALVSADSTDATGVYYVSPSGSDSNSGTLNQPWKTVGKAAWMVKPGDTVYVRGGTYAESIGLSNSGTAAAPIKFLAYPGETPVVDGSSLGLGEGSFLFKVLGDYIYASGFEIRNSGYGGVLVFGSYDVVSSMYVHHNHDMGIFIGQGAHSIVQDSRVWRNAMNNENGQASMWSAGLSAGRFGVTYATMRRNTVWENWGEGISTGEADGTTIEDNIVHDNFSANIYILDATNILCQRNFVYVSGTLSGGSQVGIMLGDEKYTPSSANIEVINNIVYGANRNFYWWQGSQGGGMNNVTIAYNTFVNSSGTAGVVIAGGSHQNVHFQNNLVQQDGSLPIIIAIQNPELHFSNNLWSKNPPRAASGAGDIKGNPKFQKIGSVFNPEWYELSISSPELDKAMPIQRIQDDFFGHPRSSLPDIGAIELQAP